MDLQLDGARLAREPAAILVRVVARAIGTVVGPCARRVRLERLEARVLGSIRPALVRGERLRLTLAHALVEIEADRRMRLRPEGERWRGRA